METLYNTYQNLLAPRHCGAWGGPEGMEGGVGLAPLGKILFILLIRVPFRTISESQKEKLAAEGTGSNPCLQVLLVSSLRGSSRLVPPAAVPPLIVTTAVQQATFQSTFSVGRIEYM